MKESKYKKELAEFDVEKAYKTEEVMGMLKSQPKRKFTESVDVAVKLGIDPKKSDQNVRGSLTLPNSLGKSIVVAAFVEGDKAEEAKKYEGEGISAPENITNEQAEETNVEQSVESINTETETTTEENIEEKTLPEESNNQEEKQIIIFVCVGAVKKTNIWTRTRTKTLFALGTRQAMETEKKTKTRTYLENICLRPRFG